jgi:hypothetical protein
MAAIPLPPCANGSCSDVHRNALGPQDPVLGVRNLRILASDQARPSLDHRHLTAEPPVYLRKLKTNVAPTDDDQMSWNGIEVQYCIPRAAMRRASEDAPGRFQ